MFFKRLKIEEPSALAEISGTILEPYAPLRLFCVLFDENQIRTETNLVVFLHCRLVHLEYLVEASPEPKLF